MQTATITVITVVVQDGDAFSFGHRRDQQVGQADRPHAPAVPQGGLDVNRASPVLIVVSSPPPLTRSLPNKFAGKRHKNEALPLN